MSVANQLLILIGASVRAAAFSALRAGLRPWCADLFGDEDLRRVCPVLVPVPERYPKGFAGVLAGAPAAPWLYTGGLENRRPLIRRLARMRPLWGNDARALAAVRSPFRLREILVSAGLPCPEVQPATSSPPADARRWLIKPRAGAGGAGIRFLRGDPLPRRTTRFYLQEYIEGESGSALFVGDSAGASLLGVTRQLTGEPWLHAGPFGYCGNIGPRDVSSAVIDTLTAIGRRLAESAELRGLFGVDFVLRDGLPWPVEVNPRYTASVEVLEYAGNLRALALHRQVFEGTPVGPVSTFREAECIGKAVYYAPHALTVPADGPWSETLRRPPPLDEPPAFADIPRAGQPVEAGRPVLTFFARAATESGCLARLRQIAHDLDSLLARG